MIKYLSLLLLVLVLEGCDNTTDDRGNHVKNGIQTIEVNGCEYVLFVQNSHGSNSMVHAGNCHNPIHHLYPDSTRITMGYGSITADNKIIAIDYKKSQVKKVKWDRWKRPANAYLDTHTYYNPNGLIITDSIRIRDLPDTAAYPLHPKTIDQ